jgi:hypothetical protein
MEKIRDERRRELLATWRASGKSVKQYCKESGINHHTFYWWLKAEERLPIIVNYGPYRIEISNGFDSEALQSVLKILGTVYVS